MALDTTKTFCLNSWKFFRVFKRAHNNIAIIIVGLCLIIYIIFIVYSQDLKVIYKRNRNSKSNYLLLAHFITLFGPYISKVLLLILTIEIIYEACTARNANELYACISSSLLILFCSTWPFVLAYTNEDIDKNFKLFWFMQEENTPVFPKKLPQQNKILKIK